MKNFDITQAGATPLSRRKFVLGASAVAAISTLPLANKSWASANNINQNPQPLTGKVFDLNIGYNKVNFTGKEVITTTLNGGVPGPILRWKEGERVTLRVTNNLSEDTSIHWHGLILPYQMDGVPGLSYNGIKPGETFEYQFDLQQSGTYWYHSHSGYQEQTGLYGAIVIKPKEKDPYEFDRDYVIQLSDWSDENPEDVYAKLKKMGDYYNRNERTVGDLYQDIKQNGVADTWSKRSMWNRMRMSDRDISDVSGATYTFLMNGQTPDTGWKGLFKKGEKVRLRFINASAMTFFDVSIPGLKMTVIASDGQNIEPVSVDDFRMGVAETYDVIVEPKDDSAYSVFAQAIDRSGYARGSLTPDLAMSAPVPAMDALPILTHSDMGMDMSNMSGMGHGGMAMGGMKGMDHSKMDMGNMKSMDHSKMNMGGMKGMDHSKMNMGGMKGMDHSKMGHGQMNMAANPSVSGKFGSGKVGFGSNQKIIHSENEFGPHIDARAKSPQYRMDDPGIGLRDHKQLGRKVLTYADIFNLYNTEDLREPSREIVLHLTGNMSRYMWSINGVPYSEADPLNFKYGERIRITFVNDTMMNHPMHLHGMWSELETGDGKRLPRKHTVIVQPGAKISYMVTADAKGKWAYHCHLLFHMAGMFREVHVS